MDFDHLSADLTRPVVARTQCGKNAHIDQPSPGKSDHLTLLIVRKILRSGKSAGEGQDIRLFHDGTKYSASTILDAQAKQVKIVIENSGYKKAAGQ